MKHNYGQFFALLDMFWTSQTGWRPSKLQESGADFGIDDPDLPGKWAGWGESEPVETPVTVRGNQYSRGNTEANWRKNICTIIIHYLLLLFIVFFLMFFFFFLKAPWLFLKSQPLSKMNSTCIVRPYGSIPQRRKQLVYSGINNALLNLWYVIEFHWSTRIPSNQI